MKILDGAKVFIKNKNNGKYLFVLRDNKKEIPNANCWSLLGGGIEKGEKPIDALKREISEEINIKLFDIKKINTRKVNLCVCNKKYIVDGHIFYATTDAKIKDIKLSEGQKVEYFTLEEIKKQNNLSTGALSFLDYYSKLIK